MTEAYLEEKEVRRLEKAATNFRDRLLIRLLFHLGCRISEALAITVDDIELDKSTVTIGHLKTRMNLACPACDAKLARSYAYCPKCGAEVEKVVTKEKAHRRVRTLPIDDDTLRMLKDYIHRGGPVSKEGKTVLFGIRRHRAWQVIISCAKRASLPKLRNLETGKVHSVSPHRLRDAFAVYAVKLDDSGDGLRMLQEYLGHQSIATTMRYRKISGGEIRKWHQRLWNTSTS